MKFSDLSAMDRGRLSDELVKLKKEQFNLRFQRAASALDKPSRVREVRRDIARVQTALRAKSSEQKTQG